MSVLSRFLPASLARPKSLSIEQAAQILRTDPAALVEFERVYSGFEDQGTDPASVMAGNSRQAAEVTRGLDRGDAALNTLIERIAEELLALPTQAQSHRELEQAITDRSLVAREEVTAFGPRAPQLTGTMAQVDIDKPAYPMLLQVWAAAMAQQDPKARERGLLRFVQGLDITDLDPVTHAMLGMNRNAMSHWFGPLKHAIAAAGSSLLVPRTTIATVPLPILQLTRLDFASLTPASKHVVDLWAQQAFALDPEQDYFIKTGTFSSKFDFRNARVTDPAEVLEIGQYLLYIHHQANQMASPLNLPGPMIGASTTNEWVVREWIEDHSGSPSIYHGMPLRTEFRTFIDVDTQEVLAVAPYWDPAVMIPRFESSADSGTPDMIHDAVVFRAHEPVLTERFERMKATVERKVAELLPHLGLSGQWSLDVMMNDDAGEELWAIDMALADSSALSEHVPAGRLNAQPIDWIPRLEN